MGSRRGAGGREGPSQRALNARPARCLQSVNTSRAVLKFKGKRQMRSNLTAWVKAGLLSAAVVLGGASAVCAQGGDAGRDPGAARGDAGFRDDDRGFPWGLLGLVGLVGLAGLSKREHRDTAGYGRTTTAGAH